MRPRKYIRKKRDKEEQQKWLESCREKKEQEIQPLVLKWEELLPFYDRKLLFLGGTSSTTYFIRVWNRDGKRNQGQDVFRTSKYPLFRELDQGKTFLKEKFGVRPLDFIDDPHILYVALLMRKKEPHDVIVGVTEPSRNIFEKWGMSKKTDYLSQARDFLEKPCEVVRNIWQVPSTPVLGGYDIQRPDAQMWVFILGKFDGKDIHAGVKGWVALHDFLMGKERDLRIRVYRGG